MVTRPRLPLGAGVFGKLQPVMPGARDILLRRNFAIVEASDEADEAQTSSFFAEGLEEPIVISLGSPGPSVGGTGREPCL